MRDNSLGDADPRKVNGASHSNGDGSSLEESAHADPHGRAALLLIESLIHELVDKAVLTRGEAIDIIDIAIEVEQELAMVSGQVSPRRRESPLAPLAATFRSITDE